MVTFTAVLETGRCPDYKKRVVAVPHKGIPMLLEHFA